MRRDRVLAARAYQAYTEIISHAHSLGSLAKSLRLSRPVTTRVLRRLRLDLSQSMLDLRREPSSFGKVYRIRSHRDRTGRFWKWRAGNYVNRALTTMDADPKTRVNGLVYGRDWP